MTAILTKQAPPQRPFPWRCRASGCGNWSVVLAKIEYYITTERGGVLLDVRIPELEIPKCKDCGELVFTDAVDDQIEEVIEAHLEKQA